MTSGVSSPQGPSKERRLSAPFAPPGEGSERAAVVAAVRTWIGTPYHHMADIRGVGVDCAMLLVRAIATSGLSSRSTRGPTRAIGSTIAVEERYLGFLLPRARLIEAPGLGDVILFRIGRCFAHGGIVTRSTR